MKLVGEGTKVDDWATLEQRKASQELLFFSKSLRRRRMMAALKMSFVRTSPGFAGAALQSWFLQSFDLPDQSEGSLLKC